MELSSVLQVIGVAALPVVETRGAVPMGILKGLSPAYAILFAAAGSLLPVIPLYYVFSPVGGKIRNLPVLSKVFTILENNARKKGDAIQKWESLGLFLFVAVPLPMTGVWTGTVAASLLGIRIGYALVSISLGSLASGMIVAMITNGVLAL